MELVLSPGRIGGGEKNGSPFQNQEVREWSHVDRLTGMLEHARIETGRWQTHHQGSAQAYGKVIDSRERNSADGNVVQKARRQVEVFQSQGVSGRSVQVVRASQWSSSRITDSTSSSPVSVSMTESQSSLRNGNDELQGPGGKSLFRRVQQCDDAQSLTKLSQVSRLCRQINAETGVGSFGNLRGKHSSPHVSPLLGNRLRNLNHDLSYREYDRNVSNFPLTNSPKKSTSNEDLTKSVDNENVRLKFNRDCKARRSLQIQKSSEIVTTSVDNKEHQDPGIEIPLHFNSYENNETRTMNCAVQINKDFGDRDLLSSDRDVRNFATNGDRKKLKSYVLGMRDESDSDSSLTVESKYPRNGERVFNGVNSTAAGEENGINKEVGKCQYIKPTPIMLKPVNSVQLNANQGITAKANTTVVHLNNTKVFPDPETDQTTIDDGSGKLQSEIKTVANVNGNDDLNSAVTSSRSVKRVGFCKTEVHFAAESGKVNIVETDCKPPPSNRYRRRRRSNIVAGQLPATNKNLPLIHFGDTTYEKYIFGQSNGSLKNEFKNGAADSKFIDNLQPDASAVLIRDEQQRLQNAAADDLMTTIKDGWSARIKTILQSEPAVIEENDDLNAPENFDDIDDTIAVDHTFKGHKTTVNLGANGLSKLMQKHANEGKCNTISTGIQLQLNTKVEKLRPITTSHIIPCVDDVSKNTCPAKIIPSAVKTLGPIVVSSTISKIPRPLVRAHQSSFLKSTHLVMNLSKINDFKSIVNGKENPPLIIANKNKDGSLNIKNLLSSLQNNNKNSAQLTMSRENSKDVDIVNNNYANNTSTLITINMNEVTSDLKTKATINGTEYPVTRFTPLQLRHLNNDFLDRSEERMKIEDSSNEGKDNNQLQYSSGSEQADEEVRSYMLGSKIHHRLNIQHKKFLHSIAMEKSRKIHNFKERHLGPSTVNERKDINSIDVIDQNTVNVSSIDDDDLDTANSGVPVEEICFESNSTVEKNQTQDTVLNERKVITSDNENNKVLLNIVTTHEPVIARVEESHSLETRRELFAGNKLHSHSENIDDKRNTSGESSRCNNKSFSTRIQKTSNKHKTKDHCDNGSKKEVERSCCLKNDKNTTDPTYVNVFERKKEKSIPIYENCYVNNCKRNLSDKKYSSKNNCNDIQSLAELKAVVDSLNQLSTNGDCESELSASLSNTDCEDENFNTSSRAIRDSDAAKLATISENTNTGKVNDNRESLKVKTSKIKSKRTVRPPSSVSSIESVHRIPVNENANDSEVKSLHSKSTRSSRLRSKNNQEKIVIPSKESAERYALDDKKNNTIERTSNSKVSRSNHAIISNIAKASNDQTGKNLNASIRSKKPIEIVYETAVFNMKNEKLAKSSRAKESKAPRYINDLICGAKPKRSNDVKHVKGAALCQQRVHHKSVSPTNRHWK